MLRHFIVKVSVLGYFPLPIYGRLSTSTLLPQSEIYNKIMYNIVYRHSFV